MNEDYELEELEESQEPEKLDIKGEIFSWIKVLLFSVLIAWVIGNFVLMIAYIPSGSMENTLQIDDKVIGLRFAYKFQKPERKDIIMFKYPDDENKDFIKRIIGKPGETVNIVDGKVFINNSKKPLDEPYLKETPTGNFGPYVVPDGCYFVLGDNRNNSLDSRFWKHKFVKKEKILAKAVVRFWPITDFKILNKE